MPRLQCHGKASEPSHRSSPSRASLSEFRIKDEEAHRCDEDMYLGRKSIPDAGGMPPYLHSVASVVFFGWRCHHTTKHFMHHAHNCSIACFWPLKDTIWAASSAGSGLQTQNPASLHGQEHDGGGPHCAPQATRTKSHGVSFESKRGRARPRLSCFCLL